MNILDTTDLQKKINEEQEKWVNDDPKEIKEAVEEEEEVKEVEDEPKEEVEATEEAEDLDEDEDRPTSPQGWKRLREKKKAAEKLADERAKESMELRERLARLEGREEARVVPKIDEGEQEPDPDLDPDEHIRWQLKKTQKEIADLRKQSEQTEALTRLEGTRRGLQMVEKEYVKTHKIADYENAIEHIKTVERNLIKLKHPNAQDAQIDAHLESERLKLAEESYKSGQNPAEYFYKMAQTLGYKKPTPKISDKPNIEALNRNMEKNKSLIGSSSADRTGGISSDKLVKMSIADLLNADNDKALRAEIRRQEEKWANS